MVDCRRCGSPVPSIYSGRGIHEFCLKDEEAEKNPVPVPETEQDRALKRWTFTD